MTLRDAVSASMVVLGLAMVVLAVVNGGGPLATGVVFGVLFALAGAGRLHLARKEGR